MTRHATPGVLALLALSTSSSAWAVDVGTATALQNEIDTAATGAVVNLTLIADIDVSALPGGGVTVDGNRRVNIISDTGQLYTITGGSGGRAFWIDAGSRLNLDFVNVTNPSGGGCIRALGPFNGSGGATLNVDNVDLSGCVAGSDDGGAVEAISAVVNLSNVSIDDSGSTTTNANKGGVLYSDADSIVDITDSDVLGTIADKGGALYTEGELTLDNVTFDATEALDDGGAIYSRGLSNFSDLTFTDTFSGDQGGAIRHGGGVDGDLFLTRISMNATEAGTSASGEGGGLYATLVNGQSVVQSEAMTIQAAQADRGGGIYVTGGTLQTEGLTLAFNESTGFGGGISLVSATWNGLRTILLANEGNNGGGLHASSASTISMTNAVFERNRATGSEGRGAALTLNGNGTTANLSFVTQAGQIGSSNNFVTNNADIVLNQSIIAGNDSTGLNVASTASWSFVDLLFWDNGSGTSDDHVTGTTTAGLQTLGALVADPVFAGTLSSGSDTSDLWLGAGSPARDVDTGNTDPDGSDADLGALGGADALAPTAAVGLEFWQLWAVDGDSDGDVLPVDCDDTNTQIGPSATDIPGDTLDQDCSGLLLCFEDSDGDGSGSSNTLDEAVVLDVPQGCDVLNRADNDDDCDDTDPDQFPGQTWFTDTDNDGYGTGLAITQCTPPAATGWAPESGDCGPLNNSIYPGAPEVVANGIDEDCDSQETCYVDGDGDGFGHLTNTTTSAVLTCLGSGISAVNSDCDDSNAAYAPDVTWLLDGDSDGYGNAAVSATCQPPQATGWVARPDGEVDCNDNIAGVNPGATETPVNGVDEDCDGFEACGGDADGDGAGDPAALVSSPDLTCNGGGFVNNLDDCAPADPTRYTGAPTWTDSDGDGFGTSVGGSQPLPATCVVPGGRSLLNTDCDDTDDAIYPGATYYLDGDGDGYGRFNTGTTFPACNVPNGWAVLFGDCNDNDAAIYPGATYYTDSDNDGFGSTPTGTTTCNVPANASTVDGDCDDTNGDIYPGATYYLDADGDDFGVASQPTTPASCGLPSGYATADGDCDDTNPVHYPDSQAFRDLDSDGFGDPSNGQVVSGCAAAPSGRVFENTDCDDTDGLVYPGATYYLDNDDDGFGTTAFTPASCGVPNGYATGSGDCNPTNPFIYPGATYYADTDDDGYGDASAPFTPGTCPVPSGYAANDDDCNDSSDLVYPGGTSWTDSDGDGFGDPVTATTRTCNFLNGLPNGSNVLNAEDCNDNDGLIYPGATYWFDADGDGQGTPASSVSSPTLCDVPDDHVTNNDDCDDTNDAIYSGATYWLDSDADTFGDPSLPQTPSTCGLPGGYSTNDGDCDDSDANNYPGTTVYFDVDADGFGDENDAGVVRPTCALVTLALNNGLSLLNTDCVDTDALIYPGATYWEDLDSDGFGDIASPLTPATCGLPAGHATNDTDCNDADPAIYPGAIYYTDADGDTYGNNATIDTDGSCEPEANQVPVGNDCNDNDALIYPGAPYYIDNDFDGFGDAFVQPPATSCGLPSVGSTAGGDCDDFDASVYPGAVYGQDLDDDGFGNAAVTVVATVLNCPVPSGYASNTDDCDDNDDTVYPGAAYWPDSDSDGFGDLFAAQTVPADGCAIPGYVPNNEDCDDSLDFVYPGASYWPDLDGDGQGDATAPPNIPAICGIPGPIWVGNQDDCDDDDNLVFLGALSFTDADGDGFGDEGDSGVADPNVCPDQPGRSSNNGDCDDSTDTVNPALPEVPGNGVDEDCANGPQCFFDGDGDGAGLDPSLAAVVNDNGDGVCDDPGEAPDNTDCNDVDPTIYPGAPETCGDGIDSDCSCLYDALLNPSESGITQIPGMVGCGFASGDEDGDGRTWGVEISDDFNGDGVGTSDCSTDSDGDGVSDADEISLGSYPDDEDYDEDGITDGEERAWSLALDANGDFDYDDDGLIDPLDPDDDNDGISSINEGQLDVDCADAAGGDYTEVGDGIPNHLDLNSDGDEFPDADESAFLDSDDDGKKDFLDCTPDGANGDRDCDGLFTALEESLGMDPDNADSDGDGVPDGQELVDIEDPEDTDDDGLIDALDTDDDGDGVATADELGLLCADGSTPTAQVGSCNQTSSYGPFELLWVCADTLPILAENTDLDVGGAYPLETDDLPDYLDDDDDGDGTLTAIEGLDDDDGDGLSNAYDVNDEDGPLADADNDGLANGLEDEADLDPWFPDTDGDGILDGAELTDTNGNGTLDPSELVDTDGDGVIDALDDDDDGDTIPTAEEGLFDGDGDGIPAYLDDDSDGDGIADIDEAPSDRDIDGDGLPDFLDADDTDGPLGQGRLGAETVPLPPVNDGCGGCSGTGRSPVAMFAVLGALALLRRRERVAA